MIPTPRAAESGPAAVGSVAAVTPAPAPGAVTIRLAERKDAEAIRSIYNREVTESTWTFDLVPRSLAEQERWLAQHAGAHPAVVAEDHTGAVIGFGALGPYRRRPAYATTVEDSVFVRPDRHRQGIGRAILGELVRLATVHGFHAVIARIVGDNQASVALHRACGFELIGVEREVGRKFGRWLDVIVMERLL